MGKHVKFFRLNGKIMGHFIFPTSVEKCQSKHDHKKFRLCYARHEQKKIADVAVSYNNNTNRLEKYRQIDDDCQKCRLLNVLVKISRSFYNIQANQYLAYHFFTSKDLKKVFLV